MPVAAALLAVLLGIGGLAPQARAAPPPPARIVSLAPSVTEILYALDAGDRLVGVCAHCNFPEAVTHVPRVGGYLAPSVEAVLATRADLVIAVPSPGNREAVRAIERAGTPVLVVADRTLADLWDTVRAIARVLDREAAGDALVARVRGELDAVRARVAGRPRRRVLLVVGHRPLIVAGGGTLQGELVEIAGGTNVAADVGQTFPQVALEVVVARAPEVIVDAAMGSERGGRELFAGLAGVPAVDQGRIVAVAPDALFRAGPRVGQAAVDLARAIHPEAFADGERPAG